MSADRKALFNGRPVGQQTFKKFDALNCCLSMFNVILFSKISEPQA